MKRAAEALRWLIALAGLGFWFTGMSVFLAGEPARWHWRCRGRELEYVCFRDGLPILDMVVPVLALLLAYPIARYVFTMWAPSPEARTLPWWPASRRGNGELLWPIGQLLAATGIVTSLWTLLVFPLAAEFWPYYLFWGASALWCALTVWIAWPQPEERGLA